jgi:hypothetical protein
MKQFNHRILLFSQFTSTLDVIEYYLRFAYDPSSSLLLLFLLLSLLLLLLQLLVVVAAAAVIVAVVFAAAVVFIVVVFIVFAAVVVVVVVVVVVLRGIAPVIFLHSTHTPGIAVGCFCDLTARRRTEEVCWRNSTPRNRRTSYSVCFIYIIAIAIFIFGEFTLFCLSGQLCRLLLVLSTRAGGLGLNLQSADTVFLSQMCFIYLHGVLLFTLFFCHFGLISV